MTSKGQPRVNKGLTVASKVEKGLTKVDQQFKKVNKVFCIDVVLKHISNKHNKHSLRSQFSCSMFANFCVSAANCNFACSSLSLVFVFVFSSYSMREIYFHAMLMRKRQKGIFFAYVLRPTNPQGARHPEFFFRPLLVLCPFWILGAEFVF